jgi:predicted aspartyl protease
VTRALAALLASSLLAAPAVAWAELWRWSDDAGTVHYTADRAAIPPRHREGAVGIGHPGPRAAPAPPADPGSVVVTARAGAPLIVDALLNGVPLRLLLDTGADRTVLSPDVLARAGVPIAGPAIRIVGVAGSAVATLVAVERLDVAGASVGPLGVVAWRVPAAEVDGLLGRDVLDAFTVTVEPGASRATLTPR